MLLIKKLNRVHQGGFVGLGSLYGHQRLQRRPIQDSAVTSRTFFITRRIPQWAKSMHSSHFSKAVTLTQGTNASGPLNTRTIWPTSIWAGSWPENIRRLCPDGFSGSAGSSTPKNLLQELARQLLRLGDIADQHGTCDLALARKTRALRAYFARIESITY